MQKGKRHRRLPLMPARSEQHIKTRRPRERQINWVKSSTRTIIDLGGGSAGTANRVGRAAFRVNEVHFASDNGKRKSFRYVSK